MLPHRERTSLRNRDDVKTRWFPPGNRSARLHDLVTALLVEEESVGEVVPLPLCVKPLVVLGHEFSRKRFVQPVSPPLAEGSVALHEVESLYRGGVSTVESKKRLARLGRVPGQLSIQLLHGLVGEQVSHIEASIKGVLEVDLLAEDARVDPFGLLTIDAVDRTGCPVALVPRVEREFKVDGGLVGKGIEAA